MALHFFKERRQDAVWKEGICRRAFGGFLDESIELGGHCRTGGFIRSKMAELWQGVKSNARLIRKAV